jgi:hypothetical protein
LRRVKLPLRAAEPKPTAKANSTRLDRVATVASIVANVTVAVSLVAALAGLWLQREQFRRNAAFDVISNLNSGEMLEAQRAFTLEVARLPLDVIRGQSLERNTIATLMRQLEETSPDRVVFRQNAITIASFFDDAQICVEIGTCSEQEIHDRMGESAKRYACLLIPYIREMREELLLDGLGDGLIKMAAYDENC